MALPFDKIPSVTEINPPVVQRPTVAEELQKSRQLLEQRNTKCKPIRPVYKSSKKKPLRYAYKVLCLCPQYNPKYLCKHVGNIVLDRDVLTKEEHICYLATPKGNFAAPRKQMRCLQKKVVLPNCTARIEVLARPDHKRVKSNLEDFKHILSPRHYKALTDYLSPKPPIEYTNINTALGYIEEERRLRAVARMLEKRSCRRLKRNILKKQRKQIRKIICVLFEEMRDFLLNDQFLIDERSTLSSVILEQIKSFTDSEFYATSNLREYQHILANNLTVWINKFISNLNIQIAAPVTVVERPAPETFLPVQDYIPVEESLGEEEFGTSDNDYFIDYQEEGNISELIHGEEDEPSETTLKNTNQ